MSIREAQTFIPLSGEAYYQNMHIGQDYCHQPEENTHVLPRKFSADTC